ncbi:MAG TPA: glycosyltransferase, partial [Nitrospiria bacterium]|nr:glycosyltransferase [Nitrospiria bacterium]
MSPTKTTTGESTLPRLLYVGDVPVEPTLSGSSLLYRLFQGYPAGNLRIVEGSIWRPASKDRLPGVAHDALALGRRRLLYSRFRSSYAAFLIFTAKIRSHTLHDIVKNFRPEAIITVAHGFSWLAASALSNRFNLPLYLIIHDDWPTSNHLPRALQGWADKQLGRVYRQARLRLCVSPYMAEEYERRYGVPGNVLYPSRSQDAVSFDSPPVKRSTLGHPPVFAYAGSIYTRESAHALNSLASAIKPLDGKLVVFSTIMDESIGRLGLDRDNIELRPVIPSNQLIVTLRNEVDALFLPMSFAECHGPNMKLSFPSKLADYTATGLPILIWAPPYSSAVR